MPTTPRPLPILLLLTACAATPSPNVDPTPDAGPDASPDAGTPTKTEHLVYAARVPDLGDLPQIFLANADGTNAKQLTTTENPILPFGVNDAPALSPDGRTVVFASGRDATGHGAVNPTLRQLYVMDADGTHVRKLTAHTQAHCSEHAPTISDDGLWVAYTATCDETVDPAVPHKEHVHRIRLDGTGDETLTPDLDGNQVTPVFLKDGKGLVFVQIAADSSADLAFVDFEKHAKAFQISNLEGRAVQGPAMPTPDGNTLYFVTKSTGTPELPRLEKVGADGKAPAVVRDLPVLATPEWYAGVARDADFTLSPDGTRLAFVSFLDAAADPTTYAIRTAALDGTDERDVVSGGDGYFRPGWR